MIAWNCDNGLTRLEESRSEAQSRLGYEVAFWSTWKETVGEEGPRACSQQSGSTEIGEPRGRDETQEPRAHPTANSVPTQPWFSPPPQIGIAYPSNEESGK